MTYRNLHVALHDSVALIRLANPNDPNNSLSPPVLRELRDAVTYAANLPAVKLVLFTGTGRSFSSGADLTKFAGVNHEEILAFLDEGQALLRQIMQLNAITVAAVNGLALGGGLELVLACDIRWSHQRAVFGLPEARHGLVPGWGGMSLLWRTVPESLCVEMLTSGEFINARRAYETGLVSRLFVGREFEATALSEAKRLAGQSGALRQIKMVLKRERGPVDLCVGNVSFLGLWKNRPRPAQIPEVVA